MLIIFNFKRQEKLLFIAAIMQELTTSKVHRHSTLLNTNTKSNLLTNSNIITVGQLPHHTTLILDLNLLKKMHEVLLWIETSFIAHSEISIWAILHRGFFCSGLAKTIGDH